MNLFWKKLMVVQRSLYNIIATEFYPVWCAKAFSLWNHCTENLQVVTRDHSIILLLQNSALWFAKRIFCTEEIKTPGSSPDISLHHCYRILPIWFAKIFAIWILCTEKNLKDPYQRLLYNSAKEFYPSALQKPKSDGVFCLLKSYWKLSVG